MKSVLHFSFLLFSVFTTSTVTAATTPTLRGGVVSSSSQNHDHPKSRNTQATAASTTYYYMTTRHKVSQLCWPGNTEQDAITKYEGRLCEDGYNIVWDSMKTVASVDSDVAIVGTDGQNCRWTRRSSADPTWHADWLGTGCGDSPNSIALPRNVDEASVGITRYWDIRNHRDPNLCYDPASGSNGAAIVKYEGTVCPNDRSKRIWNSMMTIDPTTGNAIACSGSSSSTTAKAVWSRNYDPQTSSDHKFNQEYFGECGIAPTKFPTLPMIA